MAKERIDPKPLGSRARHLLELRREAQRRLVNRLRVEEGPRCFSTTHVTQEEIAAAAGVSVETVQNIESGATRLSDEMRARLAVVYELEASEMTAREVRILRELEESGFDYRQQELFAAEKRARYDTKPKRGET
jgi:transcriptional regulator with XRE-family HTH domain